ncbi:hypothetical protein EXIGLDRAFT_770472 [Exidia glandulosa HHB12029]|uniref:Uncharacterized protein n=1 Tax=Exidia glandulosa HHB12029 TaxID=1314781 RepID=A0A165GP76_EXIGL|nr:hypothetical protein EXIGLDRAFT_770472 [Exidia glandulosa HHB12029]
MSSPSGSGSSSDSSDSEPERMVVDTTKTKSTKGQGKVRSAARVDDSGSDHDEVRRHAAYAPPPQFTLLNTIQTDADFDWDAVEKDDDLELWLIRVPEGFKSKQLESASLQAPTRKSAQLGSIKRKSGSTVTHIVKRAEEDDGAEEMSNLRCLLPRKRKGGKMFRAPKPFAQHIVVTRVPATPTPDAPVDLSASKRVSHPTSVYKHRFEPCGIKGVQAAAMDDSSQALRNDDDEMDEDEPVEPKKSKKDKKRDKDGGDKEEKERKKRKAAADASTPKKSKKTKVA